MSLWDKDKNNNNRLQPKFNGPDSVKQRMAHRTTQVQNAQDVDDGVARISVQESRLVVYDTATARILFGVLPDGTFGIVISREGIDVFDTFI